MAFLLLKIAIPASSHMAHTIYLIVNNFHLTQAYLSVLHLIFFDYNCFWGQETCCYFYILRYKHKPTRTTSLRQPLPSQSPAQLSVNFAGGKVWKFLRTAPAYMLIHWSLLETKKNLVLRTHRTRFEQNPIKMQWSYSNDDASNIKYQPFNINY